MSIPAKLQERLRDRRVIPFVGAGVSMSVRNKETGDALFPNWRQLLERAADELDRQGRAPYATAVRAQLEFDKPDYLTIAQQVREGLIGSNWTDFLRAQFGHKRDHAEEESLDLARAIWDLGSPLLITTNYDHTLRWACPKQDDLNTWDISAPAEQLDLLQGGAIPPAIWHLHGKIDSLSDIVLTLDGYKRLYPEARKDTSGVDYGKAYEAALQTLRSVLAGYTLLFIGYSLDDYYFGVQLRGVNELYKGMSGPHFILARESERQRITTIDPSLQVVTFEDFGAPLLRLVRLLGEVGQLRDSLAEETPLEFAAVEAEVIQVADYGPHHPVFFVPFRQKGDQVIGREKELQDVRRQLTEGYRTAIGHTASFQGLGGLGKTQLAVEYAYRFRDEYPNGVIWLNADQDIDSQLTELAEKGRWAAPESEHKYKLDVARHRLRTYSDCLIIFDNLEFTGAIQNYLPETQASPHILVTSRYVQPGFQPIPIDPLDDELSLELLFQEAGRIPSGHDEERAAREITQALGGLPLALEMAGAYLHHRQVSWQQYLELLNLNPRTALLNRFPTFTRHEADIYSTLKINEELFKEEPRLRDVLDLLTWSGSAPMGLSLMSSLLGVKHPAELTNALGLGLQLRLLQKTSDTDSYLIHRLVSKVRREEIPLSTRLDWVSIICQRLGNWFQELKESFTDLPRYEAEFPHLRAWQELAHNYVPTHTCRLLWLQGFPPAHRGQYKEAREWVEKALESFEQLHLHDEELKAHLFHDLGTCTFALGKAKPALEYVEQALTLRLQLLGEQHTETARSLTIISGIYRALGDYKRALDYAERSLAVTMELLGEQHPDTANTLGKIGDIYRGLGDYKRALQHSERSLAVRMQLFGEQHPDTASSLNQVGLVYSELGDHVRALEYGERSLAINMQLFGEQNPATASALTNVGNSYSDLGNGKKSLEYAERSLAVTMELLGEQHPDTAISLANLGTAYGGLGDYENALEYTKRALAIQLDLFGEQHPNTAISLANVGSIYNDLGLKEKATEYGERALSIRMQLFGERHPDTASSLGHVGIAYTNLGDYKKGVECLEKALKINVELLGAQHPASIRRTINLARALCRINNPLRAFQIVDKLRRELPHTHSMYSQFMQEHTAIRNMVPGLRHHKRKRKK